MLGGIAETIAAVVAFFGLVALSGGLSWRRHGRWLRGVVFHLDEQPPVIVVNRRTGASARPLTQLRTIEVRYSSSGNEHRPEDRDEAPWLCLHFADPATRYHLNPYYLNHFTLNRQGFESVNGGPSAVTRQLR
ncbi:MAG TPA: hypothetical protein VGD84_10045, partial [Pseudonocardiaceae bacterium]